MSASLLPPCQPLESAPLRAVNLDSPPQIVWMNVARHGRFPVEHYVRPGVWCLHLYRYTGALRTQGVTLPIRPGYASVGSLDTTFSHFFVTGGPPALHLTVGFRPALARPNAGESPRTAYLPAMTDLGERWGPLNRALEEAIGWQGAAPQRTVARLWDVLWQIADAARPSPLSSDVGATPIHPAVVQAQALIELQLGEPLRVGDLAQSVDLSHNHLTRLFVAATGQTVVEYIRTRRAALARNLLQNTQVPIKTVATQTGVPDLHQFNKMMRQLTGHSPRALRLQGRQREEAE